MASFVGKWIQDESEHGNMREFMKAAGVPEDVAERCLDMRYDVEIKVHGKKWTMIISTKEKPIRSFTNEFTLGEPLASMDMFGRETEMFVVSVGDTTAKETWTTLDKPAIEISREVKGNKMFNVHSNYQFLFPDILINNEEIIVASPIHINNVDEMD